MSQSLLGCGGETEQYGLVPASKVIYVSDATLSAAQFASLSTSV